MYPKFLEFTGFGNKKFTIFLDKIVSIAETNLETEITLISGHVYSINDRYNNVILKIQEKNEEN